MGAACVQRQQSSARTQHVEALSQDRRQTRYIHLYVNLSSYLTGNTVSIRKPIG
jgi:hypothetical protein